jgi:hypothetical protein
MAALTGRGGAKRRHDEQSLQTDGQVTTAKLQCMDQWKGNRICSFAILRVHQRSAVSVVYKLKMLEKWLTEIFLKLWLTSKTSVNAPECYISRCD